MNYDIQCKDCGELVLVTCPMQDHEKLVKNAPPCHCGGKMEQVFLGPITSVFAREGFPKGDPRWEHVSDNPINIRDKFHLRDICQQNGNISRFLEDAV